MKLNKKKSERATDTGRESQIESQGQLSRADLEKERVWFLNFKKDPEEYETIVREFSPGISGYLLRRTRDIHVAEELTQETFVCAFSGFLKFEWRGVTLRGFIYKIARNVYKDWYREKMKQCELFFDPDLSYAPDVEVGEGAFSKIRERQILTSCLTNLTAPQQEAIDLFYWSGLRTREIAVIMKMKETTVKAQLQFGRLALRDQLKAKGLNFESFSMHSDLLQTFGWGEFIGESDEDQARECS